MMNWFEISAIQDQPMDVLQQLSALNADCLTLTDLTQTLKKLDQSYLEIFLSTENNQNFEQVINDPRIKFAEIMAFLEFVAERDAIPLLDSHKTLSQLNALRLKEKLSSILESENTAQNFEKQDINEIDQILKAKRELFNQRTKLQNNMIREIEEFIYSPKLLDYVFDELNNRKPISKCIDRIKNLELKKNFKYSQKIENEKEKLNALTEKLNASDFIPIIHNVSDPLNDTILIDDLLKHYAYCVGLNKALDKESFNNDRIECLKQCTQNRHVRSHIKDCINAKSTPFPIDIEVDEPLKKLIYYLNEFKPSADFSQLFKQIYEDKTILNEFKRFLEQYAINQNFIDPEKQKFLKQNYIKTDADGVLDREVDFLIADGDVRRRKRMKKMTSR